MVIKSVHLDIAQAGGQETLTMRQGEKYIYAIKAFVEQNGSRVDIAAGSTVLLRGDKPDGTSTATSGIAMEDGTVVCAVPVQMLTASGIVEAKIEISGSGGAAMVTPVFHIHVEPNDDSVVESSSEYAGLLDVMGRLEELEDTVEEAEEDREDAEAARQSAWNNAQATGQMADEDDQFSCTVTTAQDGHKIFDFRIPQAKGFRVLGNPFASYEALVAGVPSPNEGDIYSVGTEAPYTLYRWTGIAWNNEGAFSDVDITINGVRLVNGVGTIYGTQMDLASDRNQKVTSAIDGKLDAANVYNGLDKAVSGYALDARQGAAIAGKLDKANVYNALDKTSEGYALDARQGAVISAVQTAAAGKLDKANVYNALDKTAEGFALDARQGKALNDALALKASASDLTALQTVVNGKCSVAQKTITLPTTGWNEAGYTTISCSGVTAENCVIVRPAPSSNADWVNAGILCVGQSAGSLNFMRTAANTNAITVNVAIFG